MLRAWQATVHEVFWGEMGLYMREEGKTGMAQEEEEES